MSKEFNWFVQNSSKLKKYAGKHIAIVENEVAGVGDTFAQAFESAKKKFPNKKPLITFVPKRKVLIYYGN